MSITSHGVIGHAYGSDFLQSRPDAEEPPGPANEVSTELERFLTNLMCGE